MKMAPKAFPLDKVYRLLNHGPVVLISSKVGGKTNIMPIAWQVPLEFDPPLVCLVIGEHSDTFKAVNRTKECVVNLPTAKILNQVFSCGRCHGHAVDKFKQFQLTPLPATKVKAPLIKECIASLECRVVDNKMAKTHNLFIARVVAAWVEAGIFKEFLRVDRSRAKTLHHLGGDKFMLPGKVVTARKLLSE
jgi:flavin reductase (DIM6/NTAB) family NADH-FMN oxidoreductase RutF